MTMKSSLIVATLALSTLGFAGTKSYEFTLSSPASFGANELKPGEYKVKFDGTQATVTDEQTNKSFTVPVKVEHNNGQKFGQTTVQSANQGGVDHIVQINLGGSDTKLEVGQ